MEIIARPHKLDSDMIELMSLDEKYLLGAVHIDHFIDPNGKWDDSNSIFNRLDNGEEIKLKVEIIK